MSQENLRERLEGMLVDDHDTGLHRVKRSVFNDPELFDLEMKHIFEGNWIYLAHESQVPNINDYFTTTIGRQPVMITRNRAGELNCFINACAHRGAQLARFKTGNKSPSPAPSTAGPSTTPASCSRSRTRKTPATPAPSTRKAATT